MAHFVLINFRQWQVASARRSAIGNCYPSVVILLKEEIQPQWFHSPSPSHGYVGPQWQQNCCRSASWKAEKWRAYACSVHSLHAVEVSFPRTTHGQLLSVGQGYWTNNHENTSVIPSWWGVGILRALNFGLAMLPLKSLVKFPMTSVEELRPLWALWKLYPKGARYFLKPGKYNSSQGSAPTPLHCQYGWRVGENSSTELNHTVYLLTPEFVPPINVKKQQYEIKAHVILHINSDCICKGKRGHLHPVLPTPILGDI